VDTYLNGGLYKYAIVHGCRITVRVVNVGTEPIILASAVLPYNWTSGSPTIGELLDHPTAVRTTAGSSTGQDRAAIVNHATSKQVLGKDYQAAKYQMDYAQATSGSPVSLSSPAWTVLVSSFNALTAISYRLEVEMDWNVEFYNLDSS